jgi:hypothetical protein
MLMQMREAHERSELMRSAADLPVECLDRLRRIGNVAELAEAIVEIRREHPAKALAKGN